MFATASLVSGGLAVAPTAVAWSAAVQQTVTPNMTAHWWQWALSIPTSVHPLRTDPDTIPGDVDPSSAFCMVGQHGRVWFLGGSYLQVDLDAPPADNVRSAAVEDSNIPQPDITRSCEVPLGTAILMPVLNAGCSTAEESFLENSTELDDVEACARQTADAVATTEAQFGRAGDTPTELRVQRVSTFRPFSLPFAPDHILQFGTPWVPSINPSRSFADGYWVLVRPTRAGDYELTTFGDAPAFDFSLRIRYLLKVVRRKDQ